MTTRTRRRTPMLLLAALLALSVGTGALALAGAPGELAEAAPVGRAYRDLKGSPGVLDTLEEQVLDGKIFRAVSTAAVLHLDNGEVLRLDANTALRIDALGDGRVEVSVLSGRVVKLDDNGEMLTAGSGSVFKLGPSLADPMVQEAELLRIDNVDPDTGQWRRARDVERQREATREAARDRAR